MPSLSFRFAILSDPHIALPHTIWDHPTRFHIVEVSIPSIEQILAELEPMDLDFLLIPGDLTQHGEPDNHAWLAQRLEQLPYPVYVVPGNHDIIERDRTEQAIGLLDFAQYYHKFGYEKVLEGDRSQLYYQWEILPNVRLIGLNSIAFDETGKQYYTGRLDDPQLHWLETTLQSTHDDLVMVMIHHNVIEHLPQQSRDPIGRRYILENAAALLEILDRTGVPLIFTGHLHVQDVAQYGNLYEVTTGSLVSYPHPYRILEFQQRETGDRYLQILSKRVTSAPGWTDLQHQSKEWMGDRAGGFILRLLTHPPLNLSLAEAETLLPDLRHFWAAIADGDAFFDFPHFPPQVQQFFARFNTVDANGAYRAIDNTTVLQWLNSSA